MLKFGERMAWIIILNLCATLTLESPSTSKLYRNDYEYNEKTDSFYKLHIESEDYDDASKICNHEGAELMVPSSPKDVVQFHKMFKVYPDLGEFVWIGDDGLPHESEDEDPIIKFSDESNEKSQSNSILSQRDAITRKGDITAIMNIMKLPFICKVKAKDAPFNSQCDVYGKDYEYNATVAGCYKASQIATTWNEGFSQCRAEGAHLVVVNSEKEVDAIKIITRAVPFVHCSTNPWSQMFYFLGFRAEKPVNNTAVVFKTIFGQTLEEAGYVRWAYHEPNNSGGLEYCGGIYKGGTAFNDLNCVKKFPFVCEKEISTNKT